MAYNSAATRKRLLDAAFEEFSERGLAGARVDRIAAVASANKQAIYAYFGSKDGLFDAMLEDRLGSLADAVPFLPDDLPRYAGTLFDHLVVNPELVRLNQWKFLERADVSTAEADSYRDKAQALLTAGQARGTDETTAVDLLLLVMNLTFVWTTIAPTVRAIGGADEAERLRRHRAAVVASASAITSALTTSPVATDDQ
ncbi:TetR/AcrR family transcriptional regulator [Micromonospora sp. NBC_01796]|uniref:TetR/AcrR family transcriptional regulator n=1 Tax=Micromonospora sp. NBC_01796 TaxID=2975987 RepID=UPI002DD83A5E|nr:TetR family transcriptional regulator [Micromonospora sp. NBC_01796]WSA83119.1 TetR family transcriptional regulator [Micromonospora sp. NBC_01796]